MKTPLPWNIELGVKRRSPKDQVYESRAANKRSNQCLVALSENILLIVDNVGYFWIPDLPPNPPSNLHKDYKIIKGKVHQVGKLLHQRLLSFHNKAVLAIKLYLTLEFMKVSVFLNRLNRCVGYDITCLDTK